MHRATPRRVREIFRPPSLASSGAALAGAEPRGFSAPRGGLLAKAGRPIDTAFLVTDGLVAVLARAPGGATAEAGLVGPGGLIGHMAALGAATATSDAVALTPVRGLALESAGLARLAESNAALRRELMDYAAARIAETERLCVCAATHSVEQRLARWLVCVSALSGERPIEITHQQLAHLFGVRRASVTTSLHMLEGDRALLCRRGRVEIRDFGRLEASSCGCHSTSVPAP